MGKTRRRVCQQKSVERTASIISFWCFLVAIKGTSKIERKIRFVTFFVRIVGLTKFKESVA